MLQPLDVILRALSHPSRLALLEWLKEPAAHFPVQVIGDLVADGVCSQKVAAKWDVAQPTASRHLKLMQDAGLVIVTRKRGWTFYKRDDAALDQIKSLLGDL